MITFEEKDKLLSYILSVKSDHFIIDNQDVFPNKEVLDFEFFGFRLYIQFYITRR